MMKLLTSILLIVILCFSFAQCKAHKERWDENQSEWSPLMHAIYKGKIRKVKQLLKDNVAINYVANTRWKMTAFGVAVNRDEVEIVKLLLNTDSIENPSNYLWSACVFNRSTAIAQLLYSRRKSDVDTLELANRLLIRAIGGQNAQIVKFFLDIGADPNLPDDDRGVTPLMYATMDGNIKVIELLLSFGADKQQKSTDGERAYDHIETYASYTYKKPKATTIERMKQLLE